MRIMLRTLHLHQYLLLLLMTALTAVMFRGQGTQDLNTWITWGRHAHEYGITGGYAMDGNLYPPLANVLVWLPYEAALALGVSPVFTLKLELLVFVLATTAVVYRWSNRHFAATLCFYSALLVSALGLVYLDILFALPLLLSLYYLQQRRLTAFAVGFAVASLVKFPPLLLIPFIAVYLWATEIDAGDRKENLRRCSQQVLLPLLLLMVPVLALFGKTLVLALWKTGNAPWLSAWALNFNWIVTRLYLQSGWGEASPPWFEATVAIMNPVPDSARMLARLLYLFFLGSSLFACLRQEKTFENLLRFAMLGSFSYFMFYTGVHENHLFLTAMLAMTLFCVNPQYAWLACGVVVMSTLNLFVFYGVSGGNTGGFTFHPDLSATPYACWSDAPLLLAAVNTLYFLALWCSTVGKLFVSRQ